MYEKIKEMTAELADYIRGTETYAEYVRSARALTADTLLAERYAAYRNQLADIHFRQMLGKEVLEGEMAGLDLDYSDLLGNPTVNRFMLAEQGFGQMVNTVQCTLNQHLGLGEEEYEGISPEDCGNTMLN